jgi:UDP-N-acetyl-D-glucosamine dehydrogenase
VLGVAYKKNVDDTRESPSFRIMELLEKQGAEVLFHDPLVAEIGATREHPEFAGRCSVALSEELLATIDATVISTDHDAVDYRTVARCSRLVIDTRNVCARHGLVGPHIVKA